MENQESVSVPIDWELPEDVSVPYATNVIVQHTSHEFKISFYQIQKPVIIGSPEERQEQAENLSSVRARCVAQVYLSPSRMAEIVDALQNNLRKYEQRLGREDPDD